MSKKVGVFLVGLILLLLLLFIGSLPIFNIQTVEVNGIKIINEETIISKIFYKDNVNIFAINRRKLKNQLEKLPYVKEANIEKELPNKLIINITERKNIGYILYGDDIYVYIDGEGVVLEVQNYTREQRPFFMGLNVSEITKGEKLQVDNEKVFDVAVVLANTFENFNFDNRDIKINLDNINDIVFNINDIKVLFGDVTNIYKKMVWIDAILNNELDKNASGTLDLRFSDRNPVFSESR